MEAIKTNKYKTFYVSLLSLVCVLLFCFFFVYSSFENNDFYNHLHNALEINKEKFNIYNIVDLVIYIFSPLGYVFCLILYSAIMVVAKISTLFILTKYFKEKYANMSTNSYKIQLILIGLMFVEGLIPIWNWTNGYMYVGFCEPNIWHNPTIICMQPFAILSLIYFEKYYILKQYSMKNIILFSTFVTISTTIKPSFIFGFIPALAIIFFVDFIKTKFSNFKTVLICASSFIPSAIILLIQYFILYGDNASSIGITVGNLPIFTLPLVILGPTLIYIFSNKEIDNLDKLIFVFFVIGFLEGFFITEVGERAGHGNFTWTYECAIGLLFIFATLKMIKNFISYQKWQKITISIVMLLHLVCGTLYFFRLCTTGNFLGFLL